MEKINISALSIGDWVQAVQLVGVDNKERLTPPMRVVGLGESWINLEIDPEQGDPFEYEPSEIRGIPITAEVLEMNGFERVEEDSDATLYGTPSCSIFHPKGTLRYRVETPQASVVCWNIHELQHAMRLAKIEKEITL